MIQKVRELFEERHVTRAVIVDDAFDDRPRVGDVEEDRWNHFFDDLTEADELRLAAAYGTEEYAQQDPSALRRDQLFVEAAWRERQHIAAAAALFEEFERVQGVKRDELTALRNLLEVDLGLTCQTFGRDDAPAIAEAHIIFLDLFLGFTETQDSLDRAVARIKKVVEQRRAAPPSVVLLSGSATLYENGPRLRDGAELLGCQFRMVRKADLRDTDKMVERLYELVASYPDFLKLNTFVLAWEAALRLGTTRFLRSIRALDLPDYANLQTLVLEAEGEPVGDYVLDLYDLHLHHVLEGDEALVRAAKSLNDVKWAEYPPAQFMPTPELIDMMDGALFQNETRTRVEAEINGRPEDARLGDVFLGPVPTVVAPAGPDDAVPPPAPRNAFVVLSQACDIKHGNAQELLLMRGTVRPYTARQHESGRHRTPVMKVNDVKYSIDWNILAPEAWRIDGLAAKAAEGFNRVRRFRTPFALQLQHDFIGNLGRVGTMTAVPARFDAGVRIFLKKRDNHALLLAERHTDIGDAAYLVGRTAKGEPLEVLLLSEQLQDEFRRTLRAVPAGDLPVGGPSAFGTLREDPSFYRRFKPGVALRKLNPKGVKPFKGTPHDVVQVVAGKVCEEGQSFPDGFTTIVIEVDLD